MVASGKKRCLFALAVFIVVWIALEGTAVVAYWAINRRMISKSRVKKMIRAQMGVIQDDAGLGKLKDFSDAWWSNLDTALHPYLGFVCEPRGRSDVSDLGFVSRTGAPPPARHSGETVVALLGGSFAMETYLHAEKIFAERLKVSGKDIRILNLAAAGYKQPQQALTLSFLLMLGMKFDMVINIDGFNEVALPPSENIPKGVSPFYPRQWYYISRDRIDPAEVKRLALMALLKRRRQEWAGVFNERKLYRSPFLSVVWQVRDRRFGMELYEIQTDIERNQKASDSYAVSGPAFSFSNKQECYQSLVDLWMRSSLHLKALCDANHIQYYHFLQPTAYLAGSKPMLAEEEKVAVWKGHAYEVGAVAGYPLLIEAGKTLLDKGVRFTDLTMMFSERPEPVYRDCCHLERAAYRIVAQDICDVIRRP